MTLIIFYVYDMIIFKYTRLNNLNLFPIERKISIMIDFLIITLIDKSISWDRSGPSVLNLLIMYYKYHIEYHLNHLSMITIIKFYNLNEM